MSYEDEFEDYQYFSHDYEEYEDYSEGYQDRHSEEDDDETRDADEGYSPGKDDDDDDDDVGFSSEDQYYADEYNTNAGFQGEFYIEDRLRFRSVRDVILARMHGILGNTEYSDFSNEIKNKSINLIEKIPEKKVILYSIDVLVPVSLYMSQYKKIVSKSNVVEFLKKTLGLKNINHLDFIRYIRIVNNLENDGLLIY